MILKQGVLGRAKQLVNSSADILIYKCPPDRSAVGRLMFFHHNFFPGQSAILYMCNDGVSIANSIRIWQSGPLGSGDKAFSVGIRDRLAALSAVLPTGATAATTAAPSGVVHQLGPGDEVRLSANDADVDFMFVGMEIDDIIKTRQFIVGPIATTTIYTCPIGKIAIGRFFFQFAIALAGVMELLINELVVARFDTTLNSYHSSPIDGVVGQLTTVTMDGTTTARTMGPSGAVYHLDEGDIVQVRIPTAITLNDPKIAFHAWELNKYD